MKKIALKSAVVYGATEVAEAIIALEDADIVYRSDNLDNLTIALAAEDSKYQIDSSKVKANPPATVDTSTIKGYDSDHPFVTKELPAKKSDGDVEIYRAWRYIAVIA